MFAHPGGKIEVIPAHWSPRPYPLVATVPSQMNQIAESAPVAFTPVLQSGIAFSTLPTATPAKRKRGKSLSRRTGQDGHIEISGRWYVVRFWRDIEGQEKRQLVRERVCPTSGPGLL